MMASTWLDLPAVKEVAPSIEPVSTDLRRAMHVITIPTGHSLCLDVSATKSLSSAAAESRMSLATHCAEQLVRLQASLASLTVAEAAFAWASAVQQHVADPSLSRANVAIDVEGGPVIEWWRGGRKLTLYVSSRASADYVKVWGADMNTEMEDGTITSAVAFAKLWQWLTTS